jgi:hypothetical protein
MRILGVEYRRSIAAADCIDHENALSRPVRAWQA